MNCKICDFSCEDLKTFSYHVFGKHKIKSEDYTIKYVYNDIKPLCPICQKETRYVGFTYKKYCKDHAYLMMSEAGKEGGKLKKTWNKGKTKETDERIQKQSENLKGELNPFYGKKHKKETIQNLLIKHKLTEEQFIQRAEQRKEELIVLTSYKEYVSRQHQYLSIKCVKCGEISLKTLQAFERGSRCPICFPIGTDSSEEQEVKKYIESLGFEFTENSKKIIAPKELDIYIPEKKFAIEYNGLYWHSEENVLKEHHKAKLSLCREKQINLFNIFSDEWKYKQDIVKSMISSRLGIIKNKISARKTIIKRVSHEDSALFFEKNHISGQTNSKEYFGLYHNDELICCLALRIPRQKIYQNTLEISRFASKLNCVVVGGFSKLLKEAIIWSKKNGYKMIISYVDLRFGEGNVYKQNGFSFVKETELDYWYTDNTIRYDRFKFRAQNGLTESQVAKENKVSKIYGCGSSLWSMTLD